MTNWKPGDWVTQIYKNLPPMYGQVVGLYYQDDKYTLVEVDWKHFSTNKEDRYWNQLNLVSVDPDQIPFLLLGMENA